MPLQISVTIRAENRLVTSSQSSMYTYVCTCVHVRVYMYVCMCTCTCVRMCTALSVKLRRVKLFISSIWIFNLLSDKT